MSGETEQYEAVFVDLVKKSWKVFGEMDHATRVDDIFLGAVIASAVRLGRCLIDLESDGTSHFVRFEDMQNRARMTFRLTHLTPSLSAASVSGHQASVTIGVGRQVNDVGRLWGAMKQEFKSAFVMSDEPGIVTLDADMASGYVYAQVPLIWKLEEYLGAGAMVPDYEKIASHIYCCEVSLYKYLDGRLQLG
jgi:hypothetical protein